MNTTLTLAYRAEFMNPWHDEIGRFAPKGTGRTSGFKSEGTKHSRVVDIPTSAQDAALMDSAMALFLTVRDERHPVQINAALNRVIKAAQDADPQLVEDHIKPASRALGEGDLETAYRLIKDGIDRVYTQVTEEFEIPPVEEITVTGGERRADGLGPVVWQTVTPEGHTITFNSSGFGVTDEQAYTILSAATTAARAGNMDQDIQIKVQTMFNRDTMAVEEHVTGFVHANPAEPGGTKHRTVHVTPQLVAGNFDPDGRTPRDLDAQTASSALSEPLRMTVLHEMGHVSLFEEAIVRQGDNGRDWFNQEMETIADTTPLTEKPFMSAYAMTNTVEMHAEAFAEWANTGGNTNNPWVNRLAAQFGWSKPGEVGVVEDLPIAAAGAPSESWVPIWDLPDGPVTLIDGPTEPTYVYGDQTDDNAAFIPLSGDKREATVASASEFGNPWHDDIGRFAPKGTGRKIGFDGDAAYDQFDEDFATLQANAEAMDEPYNVHYENGEPYESTFSQARDEYLAYGSSEMDRQLRANGDQAVKDRVHRRALLKAVVMDEAITRSGVVFEEDTVLLRGIRNTSDDNLTQGTTFTDPAFVSVTASPGEAAQAAGQRTPVRDTRPDADPGTIVALKVPKGTKAMPGAEIEKEWVLPRGGTYTVTNVIEEDGVRIAEVDVTFPDSPPVTSGIPTINEMIERTARQQERRSEMEEPLAAAGAPNNIVHERLAWDTIDFAHLSTRRQFSLALPSFEFANPWHDEIGRFAPKGTGTKSVGAIHELKETLDGFGEHEWDDKLDRLERDVLDGNATDDDVDEVTRDILRELEDRVPLLPRIPNPKRTPPKKPPRRETSVLETVEFANPWHDEIGRFAPKGTGSKSAATDAESRAFEVLNGREISVPAADLDEVLLEFANVDHPVDLTLVTVENHEEMFSKMRTKGMPRNQMPQIPREHIAEFRDHLVEQGIEVTESEVDPRTLAATQSELDGRKVGQMLRRIRNDDFDWNQPPLWISDDGHVLDGHHRWAATAAESADCDGCVKMTVMQVNVPMSKLLKIANEFVDAKGIPRQGIGDPGKVPYRQPVAAAMQNDPMTGPVDIATDTDDGITTEDLADLSHGDGSAFADTDDDDDDEPVSFAWGGVEFANPWHDEEGKFAPKGTGKKSSGVSVEGGVPQTEGIPETSRMGGNVPLPSREELLNSHDPIPETPEIESTLLEHLDENGNLTPERQAIHDRLIHDALDGVAPGNPKKVLVMGGGAAAGKSSAIEEGFVSPPDGAITINPDDFKVMLPETEGPAADGRQGNGAADKLGKAWASYAHEESSFLGKRLQAAAIEQGVNFVLDKTSSNGAKAVREINDLIDKHGYEVEVAFVTTDINQAVQRAVDRGSKIGREVPKTELLKGHEGANKAFLQVASETPARTTLVTTLPADGDRIPPPVLTASSDGRGTLTVHDRAMFEEYIGRVPSGIPEGLTVVYDDERAAAAATIRRHFALEDPAAAENVAAPAYTEGVSDEYVDGLPDSYDDVRLRVLMNAAVGGGTQPTDLTEGEKEYVAGLKTDIAEIEARGNSYEIPIQSTI